MRSVSNAVALKELMTATNGTYGLESHPGRRYVK